jgi:hypothetical protein
MFEWLGLETLWNFEDLLKLILRMALDLIFVTIPIRWVYLRLHGRQEFAFSCILLNIITFSVCIFLRKVPVELGFALGLFGVFGILRFRTNSVSVRDLTYLFIAIGIGMLNSVANKKVSLAELVFINGAIAALAAIIEYAPFSGRSETRNVLYDNLSLLAPGKIPDLIKDLSKRTGCTVRSVTIEEIDLLRDSARLTLSCDSTPISESELKSLSGANTSQPNKSSLGAKA